MTSGRTWSRKPCRAVRVLLPCNSFAETTLMDLDTNRTTDRGSDVHVSPVLPNQKPRLLWHQISAVYLVTMF